MKTTIRNNNLLCLNCGGQFNLNMPIEIDDRNKKSEAFQLLHKDCAQTWVEPKISIGGSIAKRAQEWIIDGDTGGSSITMYNCFLSHKNYDINHPYDSDDFSRCYKLLEIIPEWKSELHKLKGLSPAWSDLVDNWSELTRLYEFNLLQELNKEIIRLIT